MRPLLAIARLSLRAAIRSRVVASLLVLLLLTVIGLPLTIKGDGTVQGYVQILLTYTLGFSALLLGFATLWAGCAAVSSEIAGRQLQLVAVKPVPRPMIWCGKWIGLLAMNTLLLAAAGITTYGLLRWNTRTSAMDPVDAEKLRSEVLVARRMVEVDAFDVETEARRQLESTLQRGELAPGTRPADALEALRRTLLIRAHGVAPGAALTFTLPMSGPAGGSGRMALEYAFDASEMEAIRVEGEWRVLDAQDRTRWSTNLTTAAGAVQEVYVPHDALPESGVMRLQYINRDSRGLTLLFDTAHRPRLLIPSGSFELNFLRTLGVLWVRLAFFSAIGLLAGSLFSMPVASFFSLYLIVLLQVAGYVESLSREDFLIPWRNAATQTAPTWGDDAFRWFFKSLTVILEPLREDDPLARLASGERVGWDWLLRALAVKGLLYSGVLAAFAGWALNRRELALPTDT